MFVKKIYFLLLNDGLMIQAFLEEMEIAEMFVMVQEEKFII